MLGVGTGKYSHSWFNIDALHNIDSLCSRVVFSVQHLKNRFSKGYQIEMKVKHREEGDTDVLNYLRHILQHLDVLSEDLESAESADLSNLASITRMDLEQVLVLSSSITGDDYLSKMINPNHPNGYYIYKSAESPTGISVDDFVGFCTEELRIRALVDFFVSSYHSAVLKERQDVKLRFEISSEGVSIGSVFLTIEEQKEVFWLDDYGVSQTSLEQVFNSFAAIAEKEKEDTVD